MNRRGTLLAVCLLGLTLLALALVCNLKKMTSLGEVEDENGAPISVVAASAGPTLTLTLTRTFTFSTPLFAPNSAWNQTVTGASVLPESDQQIAVTYRVLRGDASDLQPPGPPPTTWPFPDVNFDHYAIPVFRAGAGEQDVMLCDYEGVPGWPSPKFPDAPQQEGGPVTVVAAAGVVRPAGPQDIEADGHLVLYDPATGTEYDFWNATTVRNAPCDSQGGGLTGTAILEAGAVDYFDVRGEGANPNTYYSARATGVPLLAGLILPEDVASGAISHALAIAIPGLRNTSTDPAEPIPADYFYPASTTETDFYNTNPNSLAAGQRIRLKQTIVDDEGYLIAEDTLAPITRMFLKALRTYGAYVVDNAGGFTFYAEDIHTAHLDLSDAQILALIAEANLPAGQTGWQAAMEKLNLELESIPFAYGTETEVITANFEVVEPATRPFTATDWVYLPLVIQGLEQTTTWWQPPVGATWQWQLTDLPIDTALDVDVYDVDLFDNDAATVAALHAQGRRVFCYVSVGSWEDWRPDADQFPETVLGNDYEGWPGEKWLDVRRIDLLAPIMRARFDQCQAKGFDGIEPDNVDGYTNDTGFPLTYQDQIAYNTWLSGEAHARGLSIGLKNDDGQVNDLLPYFDWAMTEDCFADEWCSEMTPFITAGKAVFAAEYTDQFTTAQFLDQVCPQAGTLSFSAILKKRDLDAWRQACP